MLWVVEISASTKNVRILLFHCSLDTVPTSRLTFPSLSEILDHCAEIKTVTKQIHLKNSDRECRLYAPIDTLFSLKLNTLLGPIKDFRSWILIVRGGEGKQACSDHTRVVPFVPSNIILYYF